jgi:hypothetical protein
MTIYNNDYTPYTYLIGWSKLNIWYYGVRFSKKSNPSDLWVTYFTSSEHVAEFRQQHGEPDIIQIRKTFTDKNTALLWEHRVLSKLQVHKSTKFLNVSRGFGLYFADSTGIPQSEEHKRKKADSHRGQKHPTAGPKISTKMKDRVVVIDRNGKKFKVDIDDSRYILGELSGHTKGYFCAIDCNGNKYHITKQDPRYISGELIAHSKGRASKNRIHYPTPQEIEIENIKYSNNIVTSKKNLIWINNGCDRTRIQPEMFELYYKNLGWKLGRKINYGY